MCYTRELTVLNMDLSQIYQANMKSAMELFKFDDGCPTTCNLHMLIVKSKRKTSLCNKDVVKRSRNGSNCKK